MLTILPTKAGHCAFCGVKGEHSDRPYGWTHPEPVCNQFAELKIDSKGIKKTPNRWEVVSVLEEDDNDEG